MERNDKVFIAGHQGMVGSAIYRQLKIKGFNNIVTQTHQALDLTNQLAVDDFFKSEKIDYEYLLLQK